MNKVSEYQRLKDIYEKMGKASLMENWEELIALGKESDAIMERIRVGVGLENAIWNSNETLLVIQGILELQTVVFQKTQQRLGQLKIDISSTMNQKKVIAEYQGS